MYAIIDTETTGGNPQRNRITEIAVIIHDGRVVTEVYSTLVNPECSIPYNITQMTGITDEMVAVAPKFYEVARKIVELTENRVFVAHNVNFDYQFIRNEFSRLGYDYKRDKLCTVRLSRKLFPGLPSYSLGNLCKSLDISLKDRHRAKGDAMATAILFGLLIQRNADSGMECLQNSFRLPANLNTVLDPSVFSRLPESSGVYYFHNEKGEIIYIGKSRNIKNRVQSHFSNSSSRKAMEMCHAVASISFEETGSELIALLKESEEIKNHKPYYNRAQKRNSFRFGLYSFVDQNGYVRFHLEKTAGVSDSPLACFDSKSEAGDYLARIIDKYNLCQKLCGMYASHGHCFHYEIGSCAGACTGKEPAGTYNRRALKAIADLTLDHDNLLIIDGGREACEKSAIKIENGKYIGYGYFNADYASADAGIIHSCIKEYRDNHEIRSIIRHYLRKGSVEKIVVY